MYYAFYFFTLLIRQAFVAVTVIRKLQQIILAEDNAANAVTQAGFGGGRGGKSNILTCPVN